MDKKTYGKEIVNLLIARGVDIKTVKISTQLTEEEIGELFPKALLGATNKKLRQIMKTGVVKHLDLEEFDPIGSDWSIEVELSIQKEEPEYFDKEERDMMIVDSCLAEDRSAIVIDREYLPTQEQIDHWNNILMTEGLDVVGLTANEINHARKQEGLDPITFTSWR